MASPAAEPVRKTGLQVVLVSAEEPETVPLRRALDRRQFVVGWFPTCRAVLTYLRENPVGVVISHTELPDGTWKDLLEELSQFTPPPSLIVFSRLADHRLWAEVLNLGAYDVLPAPVDRDEATRVCTGAWLSWQHARATLPTWRKHE